jgi:1-acyl-sn-glycerol-3-phosphate acyltransferase
VENEVPLQTLNYINARIRPAVELLMQAAIAPSHTLTGLSLDDRNPQVIEQLLPAFEWVHHDYFRVRTDGWEHIPEGQVLLIGSHNGGLATPDTVMMTYDWFCTFGTQRPIYALMEPRIWQALPPLARLATQVGAIQATPQMTIAAIKQGASLLIYPGGAKDVFRPYAQRHRICLHGQQGFIKLALEWHLPIVPLISYGAHSTLIVLAEIHDQLEAIAGGHFPWLGGFDPTVFPIYLGLPWGLAIGPLPNIPWPVPLHTRVCPPIWFERYGKAVSRDRPYVDACFQTVQHIMQTALDELVAEEEAE